MTNMEVEEYKKMIESMTEEEIKAHFKSQPMKKYDRLNYIYVRVNQLLDFMKVIDANALLRELMGAKQG